MSVVNAEQKMITGAPVNEFFRFVFPSVFGMLAISSAVIVDGIFIGNFVGADALASVNLVMPLLALIYGLMIMMTVGAAVIAGKYLGEKNIPAASDVFSKTGITVLLMSLVSALVMFLFPEMIALGLGAMGTTVSLSAEYLRVLAWFYPALAVVVLLSQFARVDGRPSFSLYGMIGITVSNIGLDALLVGWFGWGLYGAALATGLAYITGAVVILVHFLGSKAVLKFIRPRGSWAVVPRAAINGFSEFLNETSAGIVLFILNWILMIHLGASGVAAFTIVNYMFFIGLLIFYGVAEGIVPLISVNFGAGQAHRISTFLFMGIGFNFFVGGLIVATMLIWSGELVGVFLNADETDIQLLAVSIIAIVWPMFLFNGANIAVSTYFTGMHCAKQSAMIAMARSLVLPVTLIYLFWQQFGYMGAFYALPVAEALALLLSIMLFRSRTPNNMVSSAA